MSCGYTGNYTPPSSGTSDKIENANGSCEILASGDTYVSENLSVGELSPLSATKCQIENDQAYTDITTGSLSNLPSQLTITDDNQKLHIGSYYTGGVGQISAIQAIDNSTPVNLSINPRGGKVGVGEISPSSALHITSDINITSGSNYANLIAPFCVYGNGYAIMIDSNQIESYGDRLYLNYKSPQQVSICNGGGNACVRKPSPQYGTVDVNGTVNASGGYSTVSDDRIKYNEASISGQEALSIISQLKPEKYEKISEQPQSETGDLGTWIPTDAEWNAGAKDNFVWHNEAGLIAQDVRAIPELAFTVNGTEVDAQGNQTLLQVSYDDIYAYHISATKELIARISDLETRIQALENP